MRVLVIGLAMSVLVASSAAGDGCISVTASHIVNRCDRCQRVQIRESRPVDGGNPMAGVGQTTVTTRSVTIEAGQKEELAADARSVVVDARDCP